MQPGSDADAVRLRSKYDPDNRAELCRLGVQRMDSATVTVVHLRIHDRCRTVDFENANSEDLS
jgi:hypothetical protein